MSREYLFFVDAHARPSPSAESGKCCTLLIAQRLCEWYIQKCFGDHAETWRNVVSFLFWPLLPTHCRCGGWMLHLITLWHINLVGLLWTGDRPVAEPSIWQHASQQTDMSLTRFEHTVSAGERRQTHVLERAATETSRKTSELKKCRGS